MANAWKDETWNGINVFPGTFSGLNDVLDALVTAKPLLDGVAIAAKAQAELFTAARTITNVGADATALVTALENYILDMVSTDIYVFPTYPLTLEDLLSGFSFDSVIHQVDRSFDDPGDYDRPQFSGDEHAAAIVVLAGAQTLTDIKSWLDYWSGLYERTVGGSWKVLRNRIKAFGEYEPLPSEARGLESVPPDWARLSRGILDMVPEVGESIHLIQTAVNSYDASGKFARLNSAMTDMTKRHADLLGSIIGQVQTLLAAITAVRDAAQSPGANLYGLSLPPIDGGGGTAALTRRMRMAPNQPLDQYMAGVVILAGSGSLTTLRTKWNALVTVLGLEELTVEVA